MSLEYNEWEVVNFKTERLRIPGGWLINTFFTLDDHINDVKRRKIKRNIVKQIFIEDSDHKWNIEELRDKGLY